VRLSSTIDIDPIPRPPAIFQIEQFASLSPNPLTAFNPIRQLIGTVPDSSSVVVGCIKLCSGHSAPNNLIHNDPKSMPLRRCAVHEFRTASVMVATLAFTQEGARRTRKRCPLWVISGHSSVQLACPLWARRSLRAVAVCYKRKGCPCWGAGAGQPLSLARVWGHSMPLPLMLSR